MGVTKSQNWLRKGSVYTTSRHSTLSADRQKAVPREVMSIKRTNPGTHSARQPGSTPNMDIIACRSRNETAKSAKAARLEAAGTRILGTYTRLMIRWSVTRLLADSVSVRENSCQGKSPA